MHYLIWSFDHGMWWGENHCGYTADIAKAGRYTDVEAGSIVVKSVWCVEMAICEPVALEKGPPKFDPYRGRVRSEEE